MYKEPGFDMPVMENETGEEKEKTEDFQISGVFMIDYAAFMHHCYGDVGDIEIPEGEMQDILLDLVDKKRGWEAEAANLNPENDEEEVNELLKKVDIARKMIEHYSEEQ